MNREEFTLENALHVQSKQLLNWKSKLNPEIYNDLEEWALASNDGKTDPFSICRGSDLDNFIGNWKPKPPMNRDEALQHIVDNSRLINQLSYDKKKKISWELRLTASGNNFVLVTQENGLVGWDIYTNNNSNSIADSLEQFNAINQ